MAGGGVAAVAAVTVASVTILLLMFTVSFAVGAARGEVVRRLQASAPAVKRWGATILIAVGLWMIGLSLFAGSFARIFPV